MNEIVANFLCIKFSSSLEKINLNHEVIEIKKKNLQIQIK